MIKLSDSELLSLIEKLLNGVPISSLAKMQPGERDQILRKLKDLEGTSVRQIARLTGLGRWVIANA